VSVRGSKGWAPIHSAASAGLLEPVLRLAAAGGAWRAGRGGGAGGADMDVVKMLCRKGSFKVGGWLYWLAGGD
jgi:hypothetical protein